MQFPFDQIRRVFPNQVLQIGDDYLLREQVNVVVLIDTFQRHSSINGIRKLSQPRFRSDAELYHRPREFGATQSHIPMKRFLLSCALFLGVVNAVAAPRPNILYIYADDLGWGSIAPNGQAERRAQGLPALRTPHLDRLAAEGINLPRAYGCTVCSPARASQQSGFHQGHTFSDRNDPNNAKKAMRADEILMGDAMAAGGYATGYWGKWGFGGSKDQEAPEIVNVQTLPTSHGYQNVLAELHHFRAHTFFQPTLWQAPAAPGAKGGMELVANSLTPYLRSRHGHYALSANPHRAQALRDRRLIHFSAGSYPKTPALQDHPDYPETAYCDDVYAMAALEFVRNQAHVYNKTGQPFFGILAFQAPHAPFDEIAQLPEWDAAYRDAPWFSELPPQAQQWAAMITRMDSHIGNLLAVLADPNRDGDTYDSIADNTLVLFQSDNGGPQHAAREAFNANGGLRGSKGSLHEGGIRVPSLAWWPSRIHDEAALKPGTNWDRVVDVTDWLPTFCELAGVPIPLGIDGVSIAPSLTGEGYQRTRPYLVHEAGSYASIIQGNFKIIGKSVSFGATDFEVYDLDSDAAETRDIAESYMKTINPLDHMSPSKRFYYEKAGALGFEGVAVRYRDWIGPDGANFEDPENWSAYQYENEGEIYLEESDLAGRKRLTHLSIARLINRQSQAQSARFPVNPRSLGSPGIHALEVSGNVETGARQYLIVRGSASHGVVAGQEIRIGPYGVVYLWRFGQLRSDRWIDIEPKGTLQLSGPGIVGVGVELRNAGTVGTVGVGRLTLDGAYRSEATAHLRIDRFGGRPNQATEPSGADSTAFEIRGPARLDGRLTIAPRAWRFVHPERATLPILSAESIEGTFANAEETWRAPNGDEWRLEQDPTIVQLVKVVP